MKERKQVQFADDDFAKSSFSWFSTFPACVTVATDGDTIAVRDSKDPEKTTLSFNKDEWKAFVNGVKAGEFDI